MQAGPEAGPQVVRIVAVGDIACDPDSPYIHTPGLCQQDKVGKLVKGMVNRGADWFFTLGDAQYEYGQYRDFKAVFDPAFRAVRSVTKAIAGNHEYYTKNARGHFRYWGRHAGSPKQPWRTFTPVKGWRVVMLDSNCEHVGGCGARSPQGKWLRNVLANNTRTCTVAMWHHPLRSSGEYAGNADTKARARPLWHMSNRGGVDVVLNGHDHIYERFAKRRGMQQFTVGTGRKEPLRHHDQSAGQSRSEGRPLRSASLGPLQQRHVRARFRDDLWPGPRQGSSSLHERAGHLGASRYHSRARPGAGMLALHASPA